MSRRASAPGKPPGSNGDTDKDKKWTEIIGGMTIYKDAELKTYLEQAGFHDVQIHKKKSWLCFSISFRSTSSGKANAFFAPESLYTLRKIDAKILMIYPPHFHAVMHIMKRSR